MDELEERILDAAIDSASDIGLQRLSVSDVARRAGISRPTLYKRFATRDDLVSRAVMREATAILDKVQLAGESVDDPDDAIRASVESALVAVSEHPVLRRLVDTEPEALIPFLIFPGSPLRGFVAVQAVGLLDRYLPDLDAETRDAMADVAARLFISYAVDPSPSSPGTVADVFARIAAEATGRG